MGFNSWNINSKSIPMIGKIRASSASELRTLINNMKKALLVPNKTLWHRFEDGKMVYTTATCTNIRIPKQHYNIDMVPFELVFEVLDPFFYEGTEEVTLFASRSGSFASAVDNLAGNYKAAPRVHVQFHTGIRDVNNITLKIGDEIITATGGFSDSDVVIFNSKTKDVSKNSVGEQAYTGAFGYLDIGTNQVEISIDGIRSADIYFYREPTYE